MIAPLACSLVGQEQPVEIKSGTRAATLYRMTRASEPYYCNYGLNPSYETHLADAGVVVSGRGPGGEVRIIELPSHPFFVATLFVPRPHMVDGRPHPIYAGLTEAVRKHAHPGSEHVMTGSCLCGKVRFEVRGELGSIAYCHCESCRKAHGTAFAATAPISSESFVLSSGEALIATYESSPGKYRCFCRNCGSPVYSYRESIPGTVRIRLGTVDGDPGAQAVLHSWVSEKARWFEITDKLPQFRTGSPESLIGGEGSEEATPGVRTGTPG